MKRASICIILTISVLTCFSAGLISQENNDSQSVLSIIKNLPPGGSVKELAKQFANKFKPSDVSILYDIALNTEYPPRMRNTAAYVIAYLNPDQSQIDKITLLITQKLPSYNPFKGDDVIVGALLESMVMLSKNTNNQSLLIPIRKLYNDSACQDHCKRCIREVVGL
jgi:hypothetical protein